MYSQPMRSGCKEREPTNERVTAVRTAHDDATQHINKTPSNKHAVSPVATPQNTIQHGHCPIKSMRASSIVFIDYPIGTLADWGMVPSAHPHKRYRPCWNAPPHMTHHSNALGVLYTNIPPIPSNFARGLGWGPSAREVALHGLPLYSFKTLSLSPNHIHCAQHER